MVHEQDEESAREHQHGIQEYFEESNHIDHNLFEKVDEDTRGFEVFEERDPLIPRYKVQQCQELASYVTFGIVGAHTNIYTQRDRIVQRQH